MPWASLERGTMHNDPQLDIWQAYAAGELTDAEAQAAAEALAAERQAQRAAAAKRARSPRPPREKLFGDGRPIPLDRNAKARIMMLARALKRPTEAGKHYGALTAKFLDVLGALVWGFHNAASGRCFPSYESIADRAGVSRMTVYSAIRALERLGILTWVNRIKRVREYVPGLFGKASASRWRIVRTSNGYSFADPLATKYKFQIGTAAQAKKLENFANNGPAQPTPSAPNTSARSAPRETMLPMTRRSGR
jgi:Helix-turn-helix domain